MIYLLLKYDNYYINKEQYMKIYNCINDPNIIQHIDKVSTYEFISYKGRVMYKLEEQIVKKLEYLEYPIKYIDDLEKYKLIIDNL
jgi:hypothetical protein